MTDIRIALSDKAIAQLPTPEDGWYLARDTELKDFFVVVGKRKRTFTVQGDLKQRGKRTSHSGLRFGRQMHPSQAQKWLFPAESATGHLAETKEDRGILSKWGNDLRQTFRTIATSAGVSEFDAKNGSVSRCPGPSPPEEQTLREQVTLDAGCGPACRPRPRI
jgi:hypothetical protein